VTEHQAWLSGDLTALEETKGLVGVGVADLTGDDWLDAVLIARGGMSFLHNDGTGNLAEVDPPPIDREEGWPGGMAIAVVDLEQDGDWDLYVGRANEDDFVAWNDAGSYRVEWLPDSSNTPFSGHFGDADGDGDLDLVVANGYWDIEAEEVISGQVRGHENRLYFQEDGNFVNETHRMPDDSLDGLTFQVTWVDVDSDGDLDLYVANDAGPWIAPNMLLTNDGAGNFTRASDCFCELAMYAMGVAITDIDGDGDPDLYITDVGGPDLLVNDGAGKFYNGTAAAGAQIPATAQSMTSWGTAAVDLNRDRCDDLAVIFGVSGSNSDFVTNIDPKWEDGLEQPDVLLSGDCNGQFQRVDDWGFGDPERGRSVAVGDFDRDGRPDLLTAGKPFLRLWRTSGGCPTGITLRPEPGFLAIGARIQVQVGAHLQTSWMLPWTVSSSSAHEWYIGLGGEPSADRVDILWPGGETTTLQDVPAGSLIDLRPD